MGRHAGLRLRPEVINGGPTDGGKMMRLAVGDPTRVKPPLIISHNSIAFDRTNPGQFDQIVADFDFRMTPRTGRADGLGFALLNTAVPTYGITGSVAPQNDAEEPDFTRSLGIGFDIYRSDAG